MSGRRSSNADGRSRRHRWRLYLFLQRTAARDRTGAVSKEKAYPVLGLLDRFLNTRDGALCRVDQLLALPHFQKSSKATPFACSDQFQRLLACAQRAFRNFQLRVQFEQIEIGPRDVAD